MLHYSMTEPKKAGGSEGRNWFQGGEVEAATTTN